jgi:DNA mismatch repair protein MutS2
MRLAELERQLDLGLIRQALAERCACALGRGAVAELEISSDPAWIAARQDELEDALFRVTPHLGGISDIRSLLYRARQGGNLEVLELLEVADTLSSAVELAARIAEASGGPLLAVSGRIGNHGWLIGRLLAALDRSGAVRDDASPRLAALRKQLPLLRQEILQGLQAARQSWGRAVQDQVTIRRDRFVLPVRAGALPRGAAIVVDVSSSSLTHFVEPVAVLPLNNRWVTLRLEEEQEVLRILADLTGQIAADPQIEATLQALGALDLIAAEVGLVKDWRLSRPALSGEGRLSLIQAWHPGIRGQPVPNDLVLDAEHRILLISGPNMGGKTATLKLVALVAVMHQLGLYVPASSAELPIFQEILADLGDEQSLEGSLSTFAAHLGRISAILTGAGPRSLVLIDELGTGTDPGEGSALAQALLSRLAARGLLGVVTTHLASVKQWASQIAGLQNASMGFDLSSLAPTYRLEVGSPGRSHGLDVAARLGLPPDLIAEARSWQQRGEGMLDAALEEIRRQREELAELRGQLDRERAALEAELARAAEERTRQEAEREALLEQARLQAERLYAEALERSRRLGRQAKQPGQRGTALQELTLQRQLLGAKAPSPPAAPSGIGPGSSVRLRDYGTARVLELRGDQLLVQAGPLKLNVPMGAATLLDQPQRPAPSLDPVRSFLPEIDIRGLRAEEGLEQVESLLREAAALGSSPVRVLHGKGEGVLRAAIRQRFGSDRRVERLEDEAPFRGGHGVTVIHLRERSLAGGRT